jgi:chromosome partitioning protein
VKIITLAAQKGGCGKSALAISCAALVSQHSKRALILDTDPQRTAVEWSAGRNGNPPEVRRVTSDALTRTLQDVVSRAPFDFVFIDTAGHDEFAVACAMRYSTFSLIPCRPASADALAVAVTARQAQQLAPHRYAFVLNQVPTRGTRADEAATVLAEMGEVAPMRIAQRMAWQDSYSARMGVSEYEPNGAAARELGFVWKWLNTRIKGLKDVPTKD